MTGRRPSECDHGRARGGDRFAEPGRDGSTVVSVWIARLPGGITESKRSGWNTLVCSRCTRPGSVADASDEAVAPCAIAAAAAVCERPPICSMISTSSSRSDSRMITCTWEWGV